MGIVRIPFTNIIIGRHKKEVIPFNEGLSYLFRNLDKSGITEANAYGRHVWVYACINAIADNISRLPVRQYLDAREITAGPSVRLFRTINPFLSQQSLIEGTMIWKKMRGEAFWHLIKTTPTTIAEIEFLDPSRMQQQMSAGTLIGWMYTAPDGKRVPLDTEEIVHFKEFNPYNPIRGLSPLNAAMRSLKTDDAAQEFNEAVLKNGSFPSSVIEFDGNINEQEYNLFVQRWKEKHVGASQAGVPALITGGGKYKSEKLSQKEINFIEQRKLSKEEIHAVYGVPMAVTGDTSAFNRANMSYTLKMFWTSELLPEVKSIEDQVNTDIFDVYYKGMRFKLDTSAIAELQEDLAERIKQALRLADLGYTANEINKKLSLGFEDEPWRDIAYMPMNKIPVDLVEQAHNGNAGKIQWDVIGKTAKAVTQVSLITTEKERKNYIIWKAFVNRIRHLETPLRKKIGRYFSELRSEILSNIFENVKTVTGEVDDAMRTIGPLFDVSVADKKLLDMTLPFYIEAFEKGGQMAFEDLGIDRTFQLVNDRAIQAMQAKHFKITKINQTVKKQLDDIVRKTLTTGFQEGQTIAQMTKNVADSTRHVMNTAANRAKIIARTEVATTANTGRFAGYIEAGAKEKSWVNSFDNDVRDWHLSVDGNEPIPIDQPFVTDIGNSLQFPGDSNAPAKEIVNCRCTMTGEL